MALQIQTSTAEDSACVQPAGEVDVSCADQLRDAIDAALQAGVPQVDVDLSQVSYIDSTGIGVLVGAVHRATEQGLALRVRKPQRNVRRVLDLLGLQADLGMDAPDA